MYEILWGYSPLILEFYFCVFMYFFRSDFHKAREIVPALLL